jgi:hypothetical protein
VRAVAMPARRALAMPFSWRSMKIRVVDPPLEQVAT